MAANTPNLDAFVQQISQIAKQHGITTLIVIGRDPVTNEVKLFGGTAAKNAETDLRALVAEKFGLGEGETAWNDT